MRILILAKKFPYPLRDGEPIAISCLCRDLRQLGASIDLLVLNTSRHYVDPAVLPGEHNHFDRIWSVPCDTSITLAGAARSLARGESYILSRFNSRQFAGKLAEILRENDYDVIQLETLFMAVYLAGIRSHSRAVVSMRSHNVEHLIWERYARTSRNPFKRRYLSCQARLLRAFEAAMLPRYDLLLPISSSDLEYFKRMSVVENALAAPSGVRLPPGEADFSAMEADTLRFGFIGAMDWRPNLDGVLWFLDEVWPGVRAAHGNVEFHIAGKSTPAALKERQGNGVIVHGEVEDSAHFINQIAVLVVPLFAGSGIKIKILEAMSLGRVVVSTRIGFEGIAGDAGRDFLQAADAEGFRESLAFCVKQRLALQRIGSNARGFIQAHFNSGAIARSVLDFYEKATGELRGR